MEEAKVYCELSSKNNVFFIDEKRKYLFCTDQIGMANIAPIIEKVIEKNISYELFFMGENDRQNLPLKDISEWLSRQKMGCYLYVTGSWSNLKRLKHLAIEVGFSNEEAQYLGYGEIQIRVFCCRCHGITEQIIQENNDKEYLGTAEIHCRHCSLLLLISDHYSSLKDAFLGYVAKL